MSDYSADEKDSRTASIGLSRLRANGSNSSSRRSSQDKSSNRSGHTRRMQKHGDRDVRDFVPQGATFTASALDVDQGSESASSSGSEPTSSDEESEDEDSVQPTTAVASHASGAINWNAGNQTAIRTTLGGVRKSQQSSRPAPSSGFVAVNHKYWRSRSASVSDGDADADAEVRIENNAPSATSSVPEEQLNGDRLHFIDSDDSESGEVSEDEDDSIMLNLGSRQAMHFQHRVNGNASSEEDEYDPESLPLTGTAALNGTSNGTSVAPVPTRTVSKEEAHRLFSKKYAAAPSVLADLDREDLKIQARYFFYDRDIHDVDLQLPIACAECLQEGHLAVVCPLRECVHCGVWNRHQSIFCPKWRRCQKCRERGHDTKQCPSALKGSASETPCDLCGSSEHLELQCDYMWKLPLRNPGSGPVLVSISCSHCTSNRHLAGDCPSLTRSMKSSSWTLKGIDQTNIVNLNSVVGPQKIGGSTSRGPPAPKRKGQMASQPMSSDDDDVFARPDRRQPVGQNKTRAHIRFGSGIGRGSSSASTARNDSRENYRARQEYNNDYNSRQRSLSPGARPRGGKYAQAKDRWQPSSHSQGGYGRQNPPPSGTSRGAPRGARGVGRGARGSRGGGNGGHRPMPNAGKKAWDKTRY